MGSLFFHTGIKFDAIKGLINRRQGTFKGLVLLIPKQAAGPKLCFEFVNCMDRRSIRDAKELLARDIIYLKILMVIFVEDIERVGIVCDHA